MISGRVSVLIPARNERFLQATITSLLTNAVGDVEILPILDGYWPNPPLKDDTRVKPIHFGEAQGMRPGENAAARIATGEFLMKLDAHCIVAPGYDAALKAACGPGDLVVPTRHSIDGEAWIKYGEALEGRALPVAVKPRHFNYHILTYPFLSSMYGEGFHGVTFAWDQNKEINKQRAHIAVDDILSSQGSCWFERTEDFLRDGPLDHEHFGFYQESQECMLRVLARGGRCLVNKETWYAHYHKGNNALHTEDGRSGRGFFLNVHRKRDSEAYMADLCIGNRWPNATRTFESMIEQHWWAISQMKDPRYAWPTDWADWEKHRAAFKNRSADAIPAHT